MSEAEKNRLFELLTDETLFGLSGEERMELNRLKKQFPEWENDFSVELAATAIGLSGFNAAEILPANLRTKILTDADSYFSRAGNAPNDLTSRSETRETADRAAGDFVQTETGKSASFFGQWLGWAVAAAACVALAIAFWLTYSRPSDNEAKNPKTVQTPEPVKVPETVKTPEVAVTPETAQIPEASKIPANGEQNETPKNRETARKSDSETNQETARSTETVKTPENSRTPNAVKTPEVAVVPARTPELSAAQKREQLLAAPDVIQTNWTSAKGDKIVLGDVVWSNAQQKGYVRLRGLPALDSNQETYQLWIIDEAQGKKTTISGGVFNVGQAGEVLVPINAQLKIIKPKSFAVSKEKAGVVEASKPSRIVAIAKI